MLFFGDLGLFMSSCGSSCRLLYALALTERRQQETGHPGYGPKMVQDRPRWPQNGPKMVALPLLCLCYAMLCIRFPSLSPVFSCAVPSICFYFAIVSPSLLLCRPSGGTPKVYYPSLSFGEYNSNSNSLSTPLVEFLEKQPPTL